MEHKLNVLEGCESGNSIGDETNPLQWKHKPNVPETCELKKLNQYRDKSTMIEA